MRKDGDSLIKHDTHELTCLLPITVDGPNSIVFIIAVELEMNVALKTHRIFRFVVGFFIIFFSKMPHIYKWFFSSWK